MNKQSQKIVVELLLLASSPLFAQGFFLNDWAAKNIAQPAYVQTNVPSQTATATVSVDANNVVTKVSKYLYGHNAAVWGGEMENVPQLMTDVSNLSPNIIRWPGGNMSNDYFWDATSQATTPKDLPPDFVYNDLFYGANKAGWTMSLDSYYTMLQKTNATGCISVNYAYARYGTSANPVAQAAHYAANWVRYDKNRTHCWEIGNENFGNWETGFAIDKAYNKDGQPDTISGDLYGKHASVFIDSMRAAGIEVGNALKIGVVTMESEPAGNFIQKNWNKGMMPQVASKADFLVTHHYYGPYNANSDVPTILNSVGDTKMIMNYVTNALKTYANHAPLPIAMTEWNINALGSGQRVSYVNGMHGILMLGEMILNKYGESTRWDFMNGWNNGDSHALFADGDIGIAKYTPRATFYYMYYFQKYFGDRMVASTVVGDTNVVSYASTFTSGQSGFVLVNKDPNPQVAEIKFANFIPGAHYYYYTLTGGTDNGDFSRSVYVNGQSNVATGLGPSNYASLQPNGSNIVNGSVKIAMPKYSVVYVLVDNALPLSSSSAVASSSGAAPISSSVKASSSSIKLSSSSGMMSSSSAPATTNLRGMDVALNSNAIVKYQVFDMMGHLYLTTNEINSQLPHGSWILVG